MFHRHLQSTSRRSGFTLVEIVIVIGLLSLVTGLAIANIDNLLPAFERTPLDVKFRQAVREARIQAAQSNRPVYLGYDAVNEEFPIVESSHVEDANAPDAEDSPYFTPEVTVEFFPVAAEEEGGLGYGGGIESVDPVPQLVFHPSGTSTPARIRFHWRSGEDLVLTLDPFSSGPLASKELFE